MTANTVTPKRGLLELRPIKGKGRGVIATRRIARDTLIEAAPVIPMKKRDRPGPRSILGHYPFTWDEPPFIECFVLGYTALLNHSDKPNCRVEQDPGEGVMRLFSIRPIKPGSELTWDYGVEPWFEVAP